MPVEPHWPHAAIVMKIVQGGMEGNRKMVVAYTELLILKLRDDGVTRQAELMRQSLDVHLGLREPVYVKPMEGTAGVLASCGQTVSPLDVDGPGAPSKGGRATP